MRNEDVSGYPRFHRSLCYIDQHRFEEAEEDMQAAHDRAPEDPRFVYYLGLIAYSRHQFGLAGERFVQALDMKLDETYFASCYYHLGLAFAQMNHHHEALTQFTLALEYVATVSEKLACVHERAKSLQLEQLYERAESDFTSVIKMNPTNAHAYFRRAFARKALGHLDASADDFETAKALDPENPHLVMNYRDLHDTEVIVLCAPGEEPAF